MGTRHLVMTDVDGIQAYLTASVRLREIVGASAIVAQHDEAARKLCTDRGGAALQSAGGAGLFDFADDGKARDFAEAAAKDLATASAGGAHLSVSGLEAYDDSTPSGFDDARKRAAKSLERHKRAGFVQSEPFGLGLARRCESCGDEPATHKHGEDWLGAQCAAKRTAATSSRWVKDVRARSGVSSLSHEHLGFDSNKLAGDGRLCLVVADGNGIGSRIKKLSGRAKFQAFSMALSELVCEATLDAIVKVSEPELAKVGRGDKDVLLPVRPLYLGGDDVELLCRADVVLDLVQALVAAVQTRSETEAAKTALAGAVSLSIVALVTGPSFPFRMAHHIAHDLLGAAKGELRRHSDWSQGAFDYAIVTESMASAEAILFDRGFDKGTKGVRWTARPLHAAPSGPRSLGSLVTVVEALQKAHFPRNKLYELRQWCSRGEQVEPRATPAIDDLASRADETLRAWEARIARSTEHAKAWQAARKALGLPDEGAWITGGHERWAPIGDLADLLELVEVDP